MRGDCVRGLDVAAVGHHWSVALPSATPTPLTTRLLIATIAVLIAASTGALMARVVPEEAGAAEVRAAAPVQAPEPVDLSPVGAVGSALVNGLSAGLPAPEESQLDAHGPTPEVRHGLPETPTLGLQHTPPTGGGHHPTHR